MDLGISGKWAIVCASSKGLGRGCAEALAAAGVNLVMNGRDASVLESAASKVESSHDVEVKAVAADVATEDGRLAVLEACSNPDILVNNAGGPPPGQWSDWSRDDFIAALDSNMLSAVDMMTRTLPGMIDRGWGRVVNITSMSVKAPIGILGLSNSARAGLTGYVAGTSRQVAQFGVTINNLLPGIHATDRAIALDTGSAKVGNLTIEQARANREATIPARRYGTAEEFGMACAFLCSDHAGYIVGQNILIDGGVTNFTI